MRFIRNLTLKAHLDKHFEKNNEHRRRGNKAVSRPNFLSVQDFIGKGILTYITLNIRKSENRETPEFE